MCWQDNIRRLLCQPITGKQQQVLVHGHWLAAPSRLLLILPDLNWLRPIGDPHRAETRKPPRRAAFF
jgi:hypothetical protein